MKKHTASLAFSVMLSILFSTSLSAQNGYLFSPGETTNAYCVSLSQANQDLEYLDYQVLNPESQFQPDHEIISTEPSSTRDVQGLKSDINTLPGLRDALRGGHRNMNEPALIDSSYTYNDMNELMRITKYHYSDEGLLELIEIFDKELFNDQPFDLVVEKAEINYDEHGNLIQYRYFEFDQDASSKNNYILMIDYEYGWDIAGNHTFYSYKEYNHDTDLLEYIERMERIVDLDFGIETYYLMQTGHAQSWLNVQKREVELFEDGTVNSSLRKHANQTGQWNSGNKQIYESWVDGYYTSMTWQQWSSDAQEWMNYQKIDYAFAGEGHFFLAEQYNWDPDAENWWLKQATEYEWEYFINAYHIISGISHARDDIADDLELFSQFIYTREDNGLWTHYLYQLYNHGNEEWEDNRQQFQEYDHNLLTYRLVQNWNSDSNSWVNFLQYTYEYDDHGRATFYMLEMHDVNTGGWRGLQRTYRDYNEAGAILYFNRQAWSIPNETWYSTRMETNEYDEHNKLTFAELRLDQNPSNMNWARGEKFVYDYDAYGFTSHDEYHIWDVNDQEFSWQYTYEYLNDFYNNTKKLIHTSPEISGEETSFGYVTYRLDVEVMSMGTALEGASFSFMDESWHTNEDGEISAFLTLTDDMSDEYSLEKDGYDPREGEMKIDRNKDVFLFMIPAGLDTYEVTFIIKQGDETIKNVSIELTGYGHEITDENGEAHYGEVAVQNNIVFHLDFEEIRFSDQLSVIDQDVLIELNLINNITATAGDNGIIDPKGTIELDLGADQGFTIIPDEGYLIEYVMVDGVSVGAVSEFTFENINQDHTIHAMFILDDDEDTYVEVVEGIVFHVFPNPASSYLNVEADATILELRIIDMSGRVLQTVKPNHSSARLPVNNLNSGLYFIQIHTENGTASLSFKKE